MKAYSSSDFSLLLGLVDSYTALDNLARDGVVKCVNWMEAFEYIVRFDKIPYPGRPGSDHYIDIITIWRDYMAHTQKKVIFAPDFTLWDKYAREFETLAISAIKQSERALDTYNKTLDSEIEEGIYIRVRQLQDWINTDLKDTRARDDYKKWKEEKESLSTTPQRESPCQLVLISIKSSSKVSLVQSGGGKIAQLRLHRLQQRRHTSHRILPSTQGI